jgi:hypothetical protein
MKWKALVFLLVAIVVLSGVPEFATAQAPTNTSPPHPTMPWSGPWAPGSAGYGTVVRYVQVPPQPVEIDVSAPEAGGSGEMQKQVVEIPGYVITETTTGFIYPQRVTLQQTGPGVYQWVTLPQQFQSK